MQPGSATNKRLSASSHPDVGNDRHNLIRPACDRIKRALDEEYYLEAIALIESVLADRLEGRAAYLIEKFGMKDFLKGNKHVGIGILCANLGDKEEPIAALRNAAIQVKGWIVGRNEAVHGLPKLREESQGTWEQRTQSLKTVALDGVKRLLEYDELDRQDRHENLKGKKWPAATCPAALAALGPSCRWCAEIEKDIHDHE